MKGPDAEDGPVDPLIWREDCPCDVSDAAVELDGVVAGVHVVDGEEAVGLDLDDAGIAEIPASAVLAQDDLGSPGLSAVLADAGADAEGGQPVAVDAHDAA